MDKKTLDHLKKLYETTHLSIEAIAEEIAYAPTTVWRNVKALYPPEYRKERTAKKTSTRITPLDDPRCEQILNLRHQGVQWKQICEVVGMSQPTARRIFKRLSLGDDYLPSSHKVLRKTDRLWLTDFDWCVVKEMYLSKQYTREEISIHCDISTISVSRIIVACVPHKDRYDLGRPKLIDTVSPYKQRAIRSLRDEERLGWTEIGKRLSMTPRSVKKVYYHEQDGQ